MEPEQHQRVKLRRYSLRRKGAMMRSERLGLAGGPEEHLGASAPKEMRRPLRERSSRQQEKPGGESTHTLTDSAAIAWTRKRFKTNYAAIVVRVVESTCDTPKPNPRSVSNTTIARRQRKSDRRTEETSNRESKEQRTPNHIHLQNHEFRSTSNAPRGTHD